MMSSYRKLKNITTAECILQVSVYFSEYHNLSLILIPDINICFKKLDFFYIVKKYLHPPPTPEAEHIF